LVTQKDLGVQPLLTIPIYCIAEQSSCLFEEKRLMLS